MSSTTSDEPSSLAIADKITLTSTACAFLSPELISHISGILAQHDDQTLWRRWQLIFLSSDLDRQRLTPQAFGYDQPNEIFEAQFATFVQELLSAISHHNQQTAQTLASALSAYDSGAVDAGLNVWTRLDMILMHDAEINARTCPSRNAEVPQTYVDQYGLPADSAKGKEGEDYWYHDSEEVDFKLEFLRAYFGGDIVMWKERDWEDGLYGDPSDWSISGTATGWVVQTRARTGQHAKGSRGRLPGSYNKSPQPTNMDAASSGPSLFQAPNPEIDRNLLSEKDSATNPLSIELPVLPENDFIMRDQGGLLADHNQVPNDQLLPQATGTPGFRRPAQPLGLFKNKRLDTPEDLSAGDRRLIEEYCRNFQVREREFCVQKQQRAREKKLIRTNSEEQLASGDPQNENV